MLYALSGDGRYLDSIEFMEEEGGRSVCELLDSMVNRGIQEGIQRGIQVLIATYKELGITYEAATAGVKEKYGLDDAEAQKDMKMYW